MELHQGKSHNFGKKLLCVLIIAAAKKKEPKSKWFL